MQTILFYPYGVYVLTHYDRCFTSPTMNILPGFLWAIVVKIVSIGRLREDKVYDWKFIGLSHNTARGAAGGAVECAELLKAQGYITKK